MKVTQGTLKSLGLIHSSGGCCLGLLWWPPGNRSVACHQLGVGLTVSSKYVKALVSPSHLHMSQARGILYPASVSWSLLFYLLALLEVELRALAHARSKLRCGSSPLLVN